MTRYELFDTWAPAESVWTPWAKAVVFAHWDPKDWPAPLGYDLDPCDALWLPPAQQLALVVDLPGAQGVAYSVKLAELGYRPVPLYSAAPWTGRTFLAAEVVHVRPILLALALAATTLSHIRIAPNAPPAFLLDANRRTGNQIRSPGDFDNRSISLPTDFPSAAFLARQGIDRALLIQSTGLQPQADLVHTLGRWSNAGLGLLSRPLDVAGEPAQIRVALPGPVKRFFYGLFAGIGLRRNLLGGFGGSIASIGGGAGG